MFAPPLKCPYDSVTLDFALFEAFMKETCLVSWNRFEISIISHGTAASIVDSLFTHNARDGHF